MSRDEVIAKLREHESELKNLGVQHLYLFGSTVSEASRHLSQQFKSHHPDIPWQKLAGIENVLRHEYHRIAHDILWHVVQDNLSPLDRACRAELANAVAADRGNRSEPE